MNRRPLVAVLFAAVVVAIAAPNFSQPLVLLADRVLDGRGGVSEGGGVLIEDGRIVAILAASATPPAGARLLRLDGATLLPGLIDTHVHIDWYFGLDGRTRGPHSAETPAQRMLFAVENAHATLRGGVTTAQSLGGEIDLDLRDWIERGLVPGPRLLTSVESLSARTGDAATQRAKVRELHQRGADVIKIFASASIRDGGKPTMSQAQLDAACGEARSLGLRAVVHAHGPESARRSAEAGCTAIEHGALLDRATLQLLADKGLYYDPNIDLVLRNYFENRERFEGVGNYNAEGFEHMRRAVPQALEVFRTSLEIEGLQIVFGTDALAGSHGRNVQELVYRIVTGGQDPGEAIVSATSLAARSLGWDDRIGSLAPGYVADVIAVDGNPLVEPIALERVRLVVQGGRVVRYDP